MGSSHHRLISHEIIKAKKPFADKTSALRRDLKVSAVEMCTMPEIKKKIKEAFIFNAPIESPLHTFFLKQPSRSISDMREKCFILNQPSVRSFCPGPFPKLLTKDGHMLPLPL